ncbi:MAG: RNA 2',3'-cyclic phosphodiesterase [Solirubrobacterales bacterium]
MAKRAPKANGVRLFVALDLPDQVRDGLAAWQRIELAPIPVLRPVSPEALHLTLAFLGQRPERDVARIGSLIERLSSPAPELRLLPDPAPRPPRRPRLIAIEAESEGAVTLQAELSAALVAARVYEPEERPFWPHLTIARTRRERRGSRKPARVDVLPRALPEALTRPFFSRRVRLYRSKLRPQGSEYVPLTSTDLKVSM